MKKLLRVLGVAAFALLTTAAFAPQPAEACCADWKERQAAIGGYYCHNVVCNPHRAVCCQIVFM